ncbi:uncharacterized protein P884DRAFT_261458 [Thermothelomyces heterothallicus CBS 202.75]|uniref:uncharacterized protein n=1 Tax=Thermothelomyces heterothallicus CBS 202.75 TaxID=1149848 RepID=UPI003742B8F1
MLDERVLFMIHLPLRSPMFLFAGAAMLGESYWCMGFECGQGRGSGYKKYLVGERRRREATSHGGPRSFLILSIHVDPQPGDLTCGERSRRHKKRNLRLHAQSASATEVKLLWELGRTGWRSRGRR